MNDTRKNCSALAVNNLSHPLLCRSSTLICAFTIHRPFTKIVTPAELFLVYFSTHLGTMC